MNVAKLGFAGRFQAAVCKVDAVGNTIESTRRVVAPFGKNMITDSGMDFLATTDAPMQFCRIGTGTTAPSAADVNLVAQVGSSSTVGIGEAFGVDQTNGYLWKRFSRRFAAGTIHGLNLTEVAMAPAASGPIFCRSLLKDGLGNPISISLLEDEVLDIVYEIRLYYPKTSTVVDAVIDGAPCQVEMRCASHIGDLRTWAWLIGNRSIGPDVSYPSNAAWGHCRNVAPAAGERFGQFYLSGAPTYTIPTYVPGSFTRTCTMNFPLTAQNYAGGIKSMYMCGGTSVGDGTSTPTDNRWRSLWGYWVYIFETPLNKTASRVAQVTVGIQWGRHDPE